MVIYTSALIPCEPVGRQILLVHPPDDGTDDDNISSSVLSQTPKLNNRTSTTGEPMIKPDEIWLVRAVPQGREELYARGKCLYWTRNSIIIKSFNFTEHIIKAFWAQFDNKDHVCVALVSGLSIFDCEGQHFQIPLPFAFEEIYTSTCGLIIERSCYHVDDPLPVLFALTHPAQEISPIIFKSNITNTNMSMDFDQGHQPSHNMPPYFSIVGFHETLPLTLVYNSQKCSLSFWRLSMVSTKELEDYQRLITDETMLQSTYTYQQSASCSHRDFTSNPNSPASVNLSNKQRSSIIMNTNTQATQNQNYSPKLDMRGRQSLGLGSLAASRLGVGASQMNTSEANTSNVKSIGSANVHDVMQTPNRARIINYLRDNIEEPVMPEVKLEEIWTEPPTCSLKPNKFFSYSDFVGIHYMVIVVAASGHMKVFTFNPNKLNSEMIIGQPKIVQGIDAVPLHSINMMAVLGFQRNMFLCSGFNKIADISVPCMHSSNIRGLASSPPSCNHPNSPEITPIQMSSARKRTSLADRSYIAPDTSIQQLFQTVSPVPHKNEAKNSTPIVINEFRRIDQTVGLDVYITYSNFLKGKFTILPIFQTLIIQKVMDGIKMLIPRDLALQLISMWYRSRRSSSQSMLMNSRDELRLFKECLASLIGITNDIFEGSKVKDSSSKPGDPDLSVKFSLQSPSKKTRRSTNVDPVIMNIHSIFYAIHLVFEDILLSKLNYDLAASLSELLMVLACVLRLEHYQNYYWLKFPHLSSDFRNHKSFLETLIPGIEAIKKPSYFRDNPPSVIEFIKRLISKSESHDCVIYEDLLPYPDLAGVTDTSTTVISLFCELFNIDRNRAIEHIPPYGNCSITSEDNNQDFQPHRSIEADRRVVSLMVKLNKKRNFLSSLPAGLNLYLWDSILNCRDSPPTDWDEACYNLIGRMDLVSLVSDRYIINQSHKTPRTQEDYEQDESIRLLFPDDIRVAEANRMLASDVQMEFSINSRQGATDDEIRNETHRMLYLLNIRTMGMPVGRGAMGLHTYSPVIGESFEVPRLELSARSLTEERPLDFSHDSTVYPWPFFHNGVAAGLRICASTSNNIIDSTWINYNRPRSNIPHTDQRDRDMILANMNNEHAGFLFALGLSGHLEKLSLMALHDYLCQNNELTKLAILIGMSAAKRGSRDNNIIKVLSIHVDALLPPNSTELDVSPPVHSASIMGVGLLYQGSGDSHISKVLLEEIGRTPGPEANSHIDRESYSLSAGLAFGLVNLCKGGSTTISSSDQLRDYMLGGHRRPFTIYQRERYFKQDCHRGEEEYINTHITAPSGTLGLGLMYHRSGNISVANWMRAPDTQKLLEYVRPDYLMLRILAYGLIMWDEIEPSEEYINEQIPAMIFRHAFQKNASHMTDTEKVAKTLVDYELVSQSYCCIVAGCCMAIALRYAGSADQRAYKTIYRHLKFLMQLHNKPSMIEQAGKPCIEACLNVLITSLAVVMAGTGDLNVMRACRYLRSRLTHHCIFYGSYMAIHMAIGILFLGSCRYSLRTSPEAIGALVCALYPIYPSHTSDNRYHLQALRHLYVLAAEPRLLIPRDIESGRPVYVNISVKLRASKNESQQKIIRLKAPCLLAEVDKIESVYVDDERYWRIEIDKREELKKCLFHGMGYLDVKHKAHSSNNQLVEDIEKFIINKMSSGKIKSRKSTALNECVKQDRVEQFAALNDLLTKFDKTDERFICLQLDQLNLAFRLASNHESDNNMNLMRPIMNELSDQFSEKCILMEWVDYERGKTDWTNTSDQVAKYIVLNDLRCDSLEPNLLLSLASLSFSI